MGVIGLTHYVSTVAGLHRSLKLKNQPVVFDGSALIYYLYRHFSLDQRCGGQYLEYQAIVTEFFKTIKKCGIVAYIIVDGHRNLMKTETTVNRRATSAKQVGDLIGEGKRHRYTKFNVILPIFARDVFLRCLKSLRVIHFVSHRESDAEAVTLANYLRCPVISQDSDYYIHPIEYGYIPLDSIEYLDDNILCSIFQRHSLAAHLKIKESLLPVFACLVGNDYISRERLKNIYTALGFSCKQTNKNFAIITNVAHFLSRFTSTGDAWNAVKDASQDKNAKDLFELLEVVSGDYSSRTRKPVKLESLESSFDSSAGVSEKLMYALNSVGNEPSEPYFSEMWLGLIEPWVIDIIVHKMNFLPVQAEKINSKSSHGCSLLLRKKLYSLLLVNWQVLHSLDADAEFEILEYDRHGVNYRSKVLRILPDIMFISVIDGNFGIKNVSQNQRKSLLLEAMTLMPEVLGEISGLDAKHMLFILGVKFWILNCSPRGNLKNLVLTVLMCTSRLLHGRWKGKTSHYIYSQDSQHLFAELQSVLFYTQGLNSILDHPFQDINICSYYNGVLLHRCLGDLKAGKSMEKLLTPEEFLLYASFLESIKQEFGAYEVNGEDNASSSGDIEESSSEMDDVDPGMSVALGGNRFAILSEM